MVILLLLAVAGADASPRQKNSAKPKGSEHTADAARGADGQSDKADGQGDRADADSKIPVRISRLETPDGPYIVATIGDFPADLDARRQDFLGRDFFERFAGEVLGMGDPDSGTTLKIAMLPQEREDRREGDLSFGKLSGHMIVLVQKRRVVVACSFAEGEAEPRQMAAAGRLAFGCFEG
ncbi:MAG: hypothetical protein M3444_09635 [Acidobacteriota bacterium]|nr:hypothetical protein [Acidobacteriota bacterium]MDQ5838265.1 hypothetical protein [Acidobacteriota bacterium]